MGHIFSRGIAAGVAALSLVGLAGAAHAQGAPAQVGVWSTQDGSENLTVTQGAACALTDRNGRPTTSGSCSWTAHAAGGILTIMSAQLYRAAPIYFSVVWVNQNTITVDGDTLYRRSN
jgi:hypothetical protein